MGDVTWTDIESSFIWGVVMNIILQVGLVALSAALPVILAILARSFRRLRPDRELTFRLQSQAQLPELDLGAEAGLLEMKWAGRPINKLVISRWSLINSGAQPVRRNDFDDDLRIQFPKHKFLGASIFAGDPFELESRVRSALSTLDTGFALSPLLWNPKESVDFTVVTEEPISKVDELDIDARIVSGRVRLVDDTGTERTKEARQQRRLVLAMAYASVIAAMVAGVLFALLLD